MRLSHAVLPELSRAGVLTLNTLIEPSASRETVCALPVLYVFEPMEKVVFCGTSVAPALVNLLPLAISLLMKATPCDTLVIGVDLSAPFDVIVTAS